MLKRRLSTQKTVYPLDYDPTPDGLMKWRLYIRNTLHLPDQTVDIADIIPYVNKILKHHKAPNR